MTSPRQLIRGQKIIDLRTYLVTGENPVETVRGATHATCIQIRSKPISSRELYALSVRIAEIIQPWQTLLIDDDIGVALALHHQGYRIDGVHLGQDDLPARVARQLLWPGAILGLTTGTAELVDKANELADVVDYIGAGPFRRSPTKQSARPPLGIDGLQALVQRSCLPVVAIGDIWPEDALAVFATGVSGIAMVRAFERNPGLQLAGPSLPEAEHL